MLTTDRVEARMRETRRQGAELWFLLQASAPGGVVACVAGRVDDVDSAEHAVRAVCGAPGIVRVGAAWAWVEPGCAGVLADLIVREASKGGRLESSSAEDALAARIRAALTGLLPHVLEIAGETVYREGDE